MNQYLIIDNKKLQIGMNISLLLIMCTMNMEIIRYKVTVRYIGQGHF